MSTEFSMPHLSQTSVQSLTLLLIFNTVRICNFYSFRFNMHHTLCNTTCRQSSTLKFSTVSFEISERFVCSVCTLCTVFSDCIVCCSVCAALYRLMLWMPWRSFILLLRYVRSLLCIHCMLYKIGSEVQLSMSACSFFLGCSVYLVDKYTSTFSMLDCSVCSVGTLDSVHIIFSIDVH